MLYWEKANKDMFSKMQSNRMTLRSAYPRRSKDSLSEHTVTGNGKLQIHDRDQIFILMTTVITEHRRRPNGKADKNHI